MPAVNPVEPAVGSTSVGVVGLFLPFLIVFAAALAFGGRRPEQLALSALLIAFPIAILVVRSKARRASARPTS
jgi:hypothetical protein